MSQQDMRARLVVKDKSKALTILGPPEQTNILYPLHSTNGVLFPYTPVVSSGMTTEYDQTPFTHSIYGHNAYYRSYPKPIGVTAAFTAQTYDEALYLLSVIHFFRSVTKSYFGTDPYERAGTPPPVLLFNYLGQFQFNNIPVIIKSFDYVYDANVDYVPVDTSSSTLHTQGQGVNMGQFSSNGFTYVPTHIVLTLELDTQYTPIKLRDQFNLDKFRQGHLVGKGFL